MSVPISAAHIRFGNERGCEQLTNIPVNVVHTVLLWDVGEVAGPGDAASSLKLGKCDLWVAADVSIGRVVDNKV